MKNACLTNRKESLQQNQYSARGGYRDGRDLKDSRSPLVFSLERLRKIYRLSQSHRSDSASVRCAHSKY